ncbi:MAG: response regulator [Sphingobacteriales bacterium]|nr:MAG: response regulator [Sphingobacteriales bacterium]
MNAAFKNDSPPQYKMIKWHDYTCYNHLSMEAMQKERYSVYLVDDDEDDREILTAALQEAGCISEVKWYKTAVELLQQLNTITMVLLPDLIVFDHYMPANRDEDLVRTIRKQTKLAGVALILYSTVLQEKKTPNFLHDGVDLLMTKGNTGRDTPAR